MSNAPLPANDRRVVSSPAAGSISVGFDFPIRDASSLLVTRKRGELVEPLVLGQHYTVPVHNASGGQISLTTATAAGDVIILDGMTREERISNWLGSQAFSASRLNADLDYVTMILQEHRRDIGGVAGGGSGDSLPDAPADGKLYGRQNRSWKEVSDSGSGGVEEAPKNGKRYVRKDETWVEDGVAVSTGGVFNVRDFGAKGGTADDTTAFRNAIAELTAAGGGVLYMPVGSYNVAGDLTLATGVYLRGDTSILSNILLQNNARIIGDGQGPHAYGARKFGFRHLGIRTVGIHSSSPIDIAFVGGSGSTAVSLDIDDLEVTGVDYQSGWTGAGIRLFNCRNTRLRNMRVMGDTDGGTLNSTYGLLVGGDADPVEIYLSDTNFYFTRTAVKVEGSTEGVYISKCAMMAGSVGVHWDGNPKGKPLLSVLGCHINTGNLGLDIRSASQFDVSHNLIYADHNGGQPKASEYIGVRVDMNNPGVDQTSRIESNTFIGIVQGIPKHGIVVGPGSGIETVMIDSNTFKAFDTGVFLQEGSNGVRVGPGNFYRDVVTPIANAGTDNEVATSWAGGGGSTGDANFADGNAIMSIKGTATVSRQFGIDLRNGAFSGGAFASQFLTLAGDALSMSAGGATIALGPKSGSEARNFGLIELWTTAGMAGRIWGPGTGVIRIDQGGLQTNELLPNANNTYELGRTDYRWTKGWFTGEVTVGNLYSTGSINGSALITSGAVTATGAVNASGNITTGQNFYGAGAFLVNALLINNTQVVGRRQPAIANPTTDAASMQAAIISLLNAARTHGLIN